MIVSEEKLLFKDQNTLIEAEPDESRSRPLEWRRSLNYLRVESKEFSIDQTHWVNESDILSGKIRVSEDGDRELKGVVKSAVKSQISISTKINLEDVNDNFYQTVELDSEKKLFSVSKKNKAQKLTISIKEGDPKSEEWGVFAAGSYYGTAGFYDEYGTNCIEITVTANKEAILDLVKIISDRSLDKVIFNFVISTFSFEVDDALREWDDSRDLLLHGYSTPAALETMVIRKKSGDAAISSSTSKSNEINNDDDINSKGYLVKDLVFDSTPFKSIKFALWTIAIVLFLILLK
jgi:hypothetical protein